MASTSDLTARSRMRHRTGPGGRKVSRNYDTAMQKLWGIPPPADACEECELRPELDAEQDRIREKWAAEKLQLEQS
jgi:hypothetical protein